MFESDFEMAKIHALFSDFEHDKGDCGPFKITPKHDLSLMYIWFWAFFKPFSITNCIVLCAFIFLHKSLVILKKKLWLYSFIP